MSFETDGPHFDAHFRERIDYYADKHPTLLVRQLACRLRDSWSTPVYTDAMQIAGEVIAIDTDGDGQPEAIVGLHQVVELGDMLYTSCSPGHSTEDMLPSFDALPEAAIDAACSAGKLYRVDLMHAYESLRSSLALRRAREL